MVATSPAQGGPRTLGRYELVRKLASGGMGEVYLGTVRGAAGFEKPVAVKRVLPHLAADEDFVRRFIDEAHIVVSLKHGNIVPVLDMGEQDGEYFIVMEYLPGKDLRDILRQTERAGRPLPPGVALYVAAELCRGLAYAHRKVDDRGRDLGIVHRDVSPANVIVGWEGLVKLTDFGVARAMGRTSESLSGTLRGKIAYMSPEQALGRPLDGRSDIYSAGVVLWECLTGGRLFQGESDPELLRKVQEGHAPPPSSRVSGLPAAVDAIARKALSPRIGDRYVDMAAFEQDLQRLLHSDFQGAGAPALSDCLRRLFPQESQASPGHPSLDDALAAGLNDLDAPPPDARTASVALPGPEPPHAQIEAPLTSLRSLRGPLLAAALGLWVGWLGMRPTGPARGTLSVDSDPAGAEVLVGGHAAGYTPWTGRSIPADTPVEIVVRSEGRRAWRREMRVPARGVAKIRATLEAHGAANHERDGNSGEQAPPPLMSWTERAWTLPRPAADAPSRASS